jgi:hypothetical protein
VITDPANTPTIKTTALLTKTAMRLDLKPIDAILLPPMNSEC